MPKNFITLGVQLLTITFPPQLVDPSKIRECDLTNDQLYNANESSLSGKILPQKLKYLQHRVQS